MARDLELGFPAAARYIVRKTADQTVNNSNTLQNDDELFLAIGANEIWELELTLLLKASSGDSDFKLKFAYPVGCTIRWGSVGHETTWPWNGVGTGSAPTAIFVETDSAQFGSMNGETGLILRAIVVNGANAGDIQLQWAQNTGTAEDNKVLKNSYLIANRLD